MEETEGYDYKLHASQLKDEGNVAFGEEKWDEAIALFTQAIEIDPDNEIFYSNRSAAYMKVDSISKALHDAEKAIELNPNFVKGYNRLGVALQGLKRFDQAVDTFMKGIALDPDNKALWSAMNACKEAQEADKKARFAAAAAEREAEERRIQRRAEIKAEAEREKQRREEEEKTEKEADLLNDFFAEVKPAAPPTAETKPDIEEEDNLLAGFFNDISAPVAPKAVPASAAADEEEDGDKAVTEKYVNQDLGNGREQFARIMAEHWQWRNLNPYLVLQLGIDATDEDIKLRYKKLSLKVHPDRLRDIPNARDAFEQVKAAYEKLCDPEKKKTIVLHCEMVIDELKKDRKKQVSKGVLESDLPDYEEELNIRLMKHFAEIERAKMRSETNLRAYSARDKMQEQQMEEQAAKSAEFDKNWSEENRREGRVGNWRDFQSDPVAKKAKTVHYNVESRAGVKHGAVQMESWKKSWK